MHQNVFAQALCLRRVDLAMVVRQMAGDPSRDQIGQNNALHHRPVPDQQRPDLLDDRFGLPVDLHTFSLYNL